MPDPREFTPDGLNAQLAKQERNGHLSPLMRAHMEALKTQEKPNFCPFGCAQGDLDENGYCDHLIGFTNDGKSYEPFTLDTDTESRTYGRKKVTVQLTGKKSRPEPVLLPIEKTDRLVKITCSSRVYRDVPVTKPTEETFEEEKPARGRNRKEPATV